MHESSRAVNWPNGFCQRDVVHTTSAGDESQGCARVEAEIGYLKSRTRLLLGSAKVDTSLWPLALRHAGEQRFRSQMALLGIKLPQLVPFGTQAMARIKRWQHVREKDKWEHPMQQITVFGPAHSMSPTSHGYYICCQGRWMRSTVVVRYANPLPEAPLGGAVCGDLSGDPVEEPVHEAHQEDELPLFDVAETSEGKASLDIFDVQEVPAGSRPLPRRLHGKQTVPGLHAFRPGGEWAWDPLQLQSRNGEGAHGDRALHGEGAHGDRALHDEGAHGDRLYMMKELMVIGLYMMKGLMVIGLYMTKELMVIGLYMMKELMVNGINRKKRQRIGKRYGDRWSQR